MKRECRSKRLRRRGAAVCALAGVMLAGTATANIIYVDVNVVGGNDDGSHWQHAYTNLQAALNAAVSGDQVWAAEGTYYGEYAIKAGTALYGGFTNGMGALAERDWTAHPTILSGDIDRDGLDVDNHDRILTMNGNTVADGVTVEQGYSTVYAAGVFVGTKTGVEIRHCTIHDHYSSGSYGAAIYMVSSSVTIEDCTIANNTGKNGMGVYLRTGGVLDISGTVFRGNRALLESAQDNGGAIYLWGPSTTTIEDCTFADNHARYMGGAIYHFYNSSKLTVRNSRFFSHTSSIAGVMRSYVDSDITIENSVFCGNQGGGYSADMAGVFYNFGGTLRNCLFVGNGCTYVGGVMHQGAPGGTQTIENCTFAHNYAPAGPGAIYFNSATGMLKNCVIWGNSADSWAAAKEINGNNSTLTFAYSDFGTLYTNGATIVDGGGNLNTDPLFAAGTSGAWSADATYDADASQSTLTHSGAGWTVNEWADTFVNPQTDQHLQFYVVSNSTSTLTVWGDASALATNGAGYRIHDYHLQSRNGRHTALGWVNDTADSPLIDAGDPSLGEEELLEPYYNGGRMNIGAYGNTVQASKSEIPPPLGTLVLVR